MISLFAKSAPESLGIRLVLGMRGGSLDFLPLMRGCRLEAALASISLRLASAPVGPRGRPVVQAGFRELT